MTNTRATESPVSFILAKCFWISSRVWPGSKKISAPRRIRLRTPSSESSDGSCKDDSAADTMLAGPARKATRNTMTADDEDFMFDAQGLGTFHWTVILRFPESTATVRPLVAGDSNSLRTQLSGFALPISQGVRKASTATW